MMIQVTSLAAFLLLQTADFAFAKNGLRKTTGPKGSGRRMDYFDNEEPVYRDGSFRFTSFFEVEYLTRFPTTDDVEEAADALATTYNKLIAEFDDPFERRMEEVRVISSMVGKLKESDSRFLQVNGTVPNITFPMFATLEVDGSCVLCTTDFFFTDQILNGRNLNRALTGKGKGNGKGKGGSKSAISKTTSPNSSPTAAPTKGSTGTPTFDDGPILEPELPTEEELLNEYSDEIQSMNLDNIVDVISLNEMAGRSPGTKKSSKKGSKKDSKKGSKKGSTKGSKSESQSSVKGSNSENQGSVKGSNSESQGSVKSSSNDSTKSSKSCKGSTELGGEPVEFTSFFRTLFLLLEVTKLELEEAVQGLATAYNRVIEDFESDARMEKVSLVDLDTGRRLSWKEVRNLQNTNVTVPGGMNYNAYTAGSGFCTDCGGQWTLKDDLTTGSPPRRRHLKKSGKGKGGSPCLRPGLPTEEEVLLEYSNVIRDLDLENIKDVLELEELQSLPTKSPANAPTVSPNKAPVTAPTGKGKGKGKRTR
jgi:hypothetical protein